MIISRTGEALIVKTSSGNITVVNTRDTITKDDRKLVGYADSSGSAAMTKVSEDRASSDRVFDAAGQRISAAYRGIPRDGRVRSSGTERDKALRGAKIAGSKRRSWSIRASPGN
jgi:hypothetical protein